jgi:hypothetical protein
LPGFSVYVRADDQRFVTAVEHSLKRERLKFNVCV